VKKLISDLNARAISASFHITPLRARLAVAGVICAISVGHAFAVDANASVQAGTNFMKSLVTFIQWALVLAGMGSIGYGLAKWRKKGTDNGGDQVEARQIWMPIAAGAGMICIWAIVEFVVTAAGGSSSDIGRSSSF
jgi:hypothetical protein